MGATLWLDQPVDYSTYLSVALTCAIIALTIVAILVGIFAIWGFAGIKREARKLAIAEIEKVVPKAVEKAMESARMVNAQKEPGDTSGEKVAEDYPPGAGEK
ncbi:MAG: hypothetical protein ACRD1E_03720 [Terriglobales bacterium]